MFTHNLPFFIRQGTWFEEDAVGDTKLADVVQQSAAANVNPLLDGDIHLLHQLHGELCHPVGVPFGFDVAQFQRPRPPFNRGVIGQAELGIRALELIEELKIVQRQRQAGGDGFNEREPFF